MWDEDLANNYNSYRMGIVEAPFHAIAAFISNIPAEIGNFFSNLFSGNAKITGTMEASLNIPGTPLNCTASYSTDGKQSLSTSVDSSARFSDSLQDLAGSPIIVSSNGVAVKAGVAKVNITKDGELGTVAVNLTSKNIVKNLDLSMGVSITASTQNGPYGTIGNGSGFAGGHTQTAKYLLSHDRFKGGFK
jgi:hypothetical protein